jgi:hypothetical protein
MFSIIRRFTLPCICCTTTLLGIQLLSPSTKESCPKNRGSVPHHVDMTLPFLVDSLYYVLQWSFRISWDEIQLHLGMSWNNLLSIQDLIGDCGMCGGWARGDSLYSIEFNQFLGSRWEGDVAQCGGSHHWVTVYRILNWWTSNIRSLNDSRWLRMTWDKVKWLKVTYNDSEQLWK